MSKPEEEVLLIALGVLALAYLLSRPAGTGVISTQTTPLSNGFQNIDPFAALNYTVTDIAAAGGL